MGARLVAASFGGICVALSFPPAAWWVAAFVGVAALLRASSGTSRGAAFLLGWIAGCAGHASAFAWLGSAIARFTGAPPVIVGLSVAAFIAYHALQLGLFTLLAAESRRQSLPIRCATVGALWVVLEVGFPRIIPWTLGDGLGGSLLLRQAADLAGPHGLSMVIAAAAAALTRALPDDSGTSPDRRRAAMAAFGLVSLLVSYGAVRVVQLDRNAGTDTLRVTLVQGGLGLHADPQRQNELAWRIYEPLTMAAVARPLLPGAAVGQLVVWPEATLRAHLRTDQAQYRRVRRLASLLQQPLMIGAMDLPSTGAGELNTAFLFPVGRQEDVQVYHKRALVPFAEYIPAPAWLPLLGEWRPIGNFVRGKNGLPMQVQDGVRLAPAICFEVLQAGGFNQMVGDGARLLVNLSDDAWFAGSAEVQQHLGMARMRAVETRRWLARASDSGVSAFIDPVGRVVAKLDEGAIGAIQRDVRLERRRSLYVWLGNWIVPVSILLLAGRASAALAGPIAGVARSVRRYS